MVPLVPNSQLQTCGDFSVKWKFTRKRINDRQRTNMPKRELLRLNPDLIKKGEKEEINHGFNIKDQFFNRWNCSYINAQNIKKCVERTLTVTKNKDFYYAVTTCDTLSFILYRNGTSISTRF